MHQTKEPPNQLLTEGNCRSLIPARCHLSPQEACGSWPGVNFQTLICCPCQKVWLVKQDPESVKQHNPSGLSPRGYDRNPLGGMNQILGKKEEIRPFSSVTRFPLFPHKLPPFSTLPTSTYYRHRANALGSLLA